LGKYLAAEGRGFSNEEIQVLPVADFTRIDGNATGSWQNVLISYFGRLNYSYRDRYLITANFRRDASPRFAPQNRWGNFPSFSAGWKISSEEFFKTRFKKISTLKLRSGWGKSGSDLIGDYSYQSSLHASNINYIFGEPQKTVKGVTVNSLPSPFAKWETASTINIGVDLGFFDNQISFTSDYFIKETNNILVQVPIPPSVGMGLNEGGGDPTINAASVENKGLETSLTIQNNQGEFRYSVSANAAFIKNKVKSLGDGQPLSDGNFDFSYPITRTEVGNSVGYFYGFAVDKVYSTQQEIENDNLLAVQTTGKFDAVYQEAAKPGDIRFKDLDSDGHITDKDRTIIGNPIPDITYGISFYLAYKGVDLSMSLSGVYGNEIFSAFYTYWLEGMIRPFNASTNVLNRWRNPGDETTIPRAVANDPNKNLRPSTRYIEDGSFWRIKNLSVGYNIPASFLYRLSQNNIIAIRVYLTAQNIYTHSNYKGFDPEISAQYSGDSQRYNLRRGIDVGQYPQPRSFLIGFQFNF
jgi:TonB-linked SusC/RagA family outer membrane protein